MKRSIVAAAASAGLFAALVVAAPASAHDHSSQLPGTGTPQVLAHGLLSPLSLEVDNPDHIYLSQNFAGQLSKVERSEVVSLTSSPGFEIGAVSTRNGTVYYAVTAMDHSSSKLMAMAPNGKVSQLADLHHYEATRNPDRHASYAFQGLTKQCIAKGPAPTTAPPGPDTMPPLAYKGIVDSHPYASAALQDGIYIADAAANDILKVDYRGHISTVAVLPPTKGMKVTSVAMAGQFGFPDCVVGHTYRFEPVPTDVELGPQGWLYVSSLPGGPEDASLGARGAVYKLDPRDGDDIYTVATGFVGTTGIAVSRQGTVYVAELFGGPNGTGQISIVPRGAKTGTPLVALPSPAALELSKGNLYVTTNAVPDESGTQPPNGEVTRVALTKNGRSQDAVADGDRGYSAHHSDWHSSDSHGHSHGDDD